MAWRYCGNQIRLWRGQAELSREELASEVGYSVEYVKSMEQGRRRPTLHLLRVADEMCGARGMLTAVMCTSSRRNSRCTPLSTCGTRPMPSPSTPTRRR
ncbi:helix-turn-helix transcriptional regulator [Streptomyces sp. NPDC026294]